MQALNGELLLEAFDKGMAEHDLARALTMLAVAMPESSRQQLAESPISERNLLLLQLREVTFGPMMSGLAKCVECSAHLEFAFDARTLAAQLESQRARQSVGWSEGDRVYQLRAVNSNDLIACLTLPTFEEAQQHLLSRCLSMSNQSSDQADPPPATAVMEKFEELHGTTELTLSVECPECCRSQLIDLDIGRFLWLEVRNAAQRLMYEIHVLAWAYGWTENSIASMNSSRRNQYLEMLSA
jgi:hypothetical protein